LPAAEVLEARQPIVTNGFSTKFTVDYEFAVHFTEHLFSTDNPTLAEVLTAREPRRRHRLAFFIDDRVAAAHPQLRSEIEAYGGAFSAHIEIIAEPECLTGGEAAKNDPDLVRHLQRRLVELGMDRHSFVVAVGGGAFLDVVGFAAATTHRGMRHIRIPTTVLSQGDSGVGVKNGVNAFGTKNLIGTFAPPFAVLNDHCFIASLEPRDILAGVAEAVKVALIRDAEFYGWIESRGAEVLNPHGPALRHVIRRSAELHARQIATGGDPFETGSARPLDYGHWAAHKLEILTGHELRHGEAVAIGMAQDARYSARTGFLRDGEDLRICGLLRQLGFELWHPALESRTPAGEYAVLAGLREFREHLGGELTVTLLASVGHGIEVHEMREAAIVAAIGWLKASFECA
jgi:3-dehydroquinate synthase